MLDEPPPPPQAVNVTPMTSADATNRFRKRIVSHSIVSSKVNKGAEGAQGAQDSAKIAWVQSAE